MTPEEMGERILDQANEIERLKASLRSTERLLEIANTSLQRIAEKINAWGGCDDKSTMKLLNELDAVARGRG